jgi:predicted RNA-binding Zn ribbon-like protein
LAVRCAGTKRDLSPCTAAVEPPQRFCWWHDPANVDKRRRAASKAGKSKPSRELAGIKQRLSDLADDVLTGAVDKGVAAVASQVLNVYLRAVSVELKVNEQLELTERLAALEVVLKGRRAGLAGTVCTATTK